MITRAYCYASGQIGFARSVPAGAIQIAMGSPTRLRKAVSAVARLAYDGKTLLVPGVPEAPNQRVAGDALARFIPEVEKRLYPARRSA